MRFRVGKIVEHLDHFRKPRLESLALLDVLDDEALGEVRTQGLL